MISISPKIHDKDGRPLYLLHTLLKSFPPELTRYLTGLGHVIIPRKTDNVLRGGDSIADIEVALALAHREIICTLSRAPDDAIYYHAEYGLVLDGEVRTCYDNDSGWTYADNGRYERPPLRPYANEITLEALADNYDKLHPHGATNWNEVILHPGARVVGAFVDRGDYAYMLPDMKEALDLFLEKCEAVGLPILEVRSRLFGMRAKTC